MNTQEQIIALLQGELKDDAQVADLLNQLVNSPENRQVFVEHIELGKQLDEYVGGILPASSDVFRIWERIDTFEREGSKDANAVQQKRSSKRPWLGVLVALLVGTGLGYLLQPENDTVPSAQHQPMSVDTVFMPLTSSEEESQTSAPHLVGDLGMERIAVSPRRDAATPKAKATEIGTVFPVNDMERGLTVLTPNGGEVFKAGSTVPIYWNGRPENRQAIVEYSIDGGVSWLQAKGNHTGESVLLSIPDNSPASSACQVRVGVEETDVLRPEKVYTFFGHDSGTGVAVAEISPDGNLLATVGMDAQIFIWDLQTGQKLHSLDGHTSFVTFAKFNQDGTKFASCSQDGSVQIWNVKTGEQEHLLLAQGDGGLVPWAVAFSPIGPEIAVSNDDGSITMWNSETGEAINEFTGVEVMKPHEEAIRYLEYSPDGKYLIASSSDRTGSIIDVKTRTVLQRFEHHIEDTTEAKTREEYIERLRRKVVNGIQLTPDGKTIITNGYDGLIKFWDARRGDLLRTINAHNGARVSSVALSPDGKLLASVGYNGTAKIFDVRSGEVLASLALEDQDVPMLRASFSPDMRYLAIGQGDGKASLWKLHPSDMIDISDSFWSIEPCEQGAIE